MADKSKRVCSVPGCGKPHHARGFCQKHYDEFRKKDRKSRRSSGAGQSPGGRVCSVEGCGRPHHAKGYCKLHYARLVKRGEGGSGRKVDDNRPPDPQKNRGRFLQWRLELIKKRHKLLQPVIPEVPDDASDDE